MDTPRSPRSRATRKSGKSAEGKTSQASAPAEDATKKEVQTRVFDDLDLAGYVEEILSVRLDALACHLEQTLGNRLAALVETLRAPSDATDDRLTRLQDEVQRLRDERSGLASRVSALLEQLQLRERELAEGRSTNVRRVEGEDASGRPQAASHATEVLSEIDRARDARLREQQQQIESLQAEMREKDVLLSETGKDKVLLGQELEKVRKERYEAQVTYERRLREMQEELLRVARETEAAREEHRLLQEQVDKKGKKWNFF